MTLTLLPKKLIFQYAIHFGNWRKCKIDDLSTDDIIQRTEPLAEVTEIP